ncbi:hypothetical protein EXIGLDRAFT_741483 [Exidia glandulosa HHB12029]|uniref:GEgh 16 protein n=1 Tax=Exidia glandulosa HHB12029 TaxID=1314781 RepID=A0A165EI65_EXIGL|nr:hypothetical protein EXIGLDRAFT_741483 [Exidia glandulosa HHB12029]
MRFSSTLVFASVLLPVVYGHGVITNVQGANGATGAGFGVIADTPRDGTRAKPFQQDSSIIRDREIERGTATACGRTKAGGVNDIATNVAAAVDAGLPTADENGQVSMTLHQVNGDGAGPYTCDVSTDATGNSFQAMTVVTQVPGKNSRSRAKATDFALVAQMPAGATCTGGPAGNACIVRCRNDAAAGPFGGCVAVTTADGAAAAANSTAAATDSADTTTATATATDSADTSAATDAAASTASAATTSAAADAAETPSADLTDADVATAEAEEAEEDEDDEDTTAAAPAKTVTKTAGKNQKVTNKGGVSSLLSKFGGNARDNKRRMVKSRIVAPQHVGMWV